MNNLPPPANRRPLAWIPTLYFAEGLPYVMVNSVVGIALLRLGWTPAQMAAFTSGLNLPWALKALWAPLLERLGTRRGWVLAMQLTGAVLLAIAAFTLPNETWKTATLSLLLGLGLAAATHDAAADGYYMGALGEHEQAEWSGLRNTFYRLAMIAGTGGLVWLAGKWEPHWGIPSAWTAVFLLAAGALALLSLYHFWAIPRAEGVVRASASNPGLRDWGAEFARVWIAFVCKPGFGRMLAFILLYRFAEGQVQKGNIAFFLADPAQGGLGFTTDEIGIWYGTVGVVALLAGGILGGLAIARTGLRRQIWLMCAAMNLPNVLYVWLAWAQPHSRALVGGIIGFEQFGYGFGFAAYMVYLLYAARGSYATAHYAICTGVMALGLTVAGLASAAALQITGTMPNGGYLQFFLWIMLCALVSFAVVWKLPLEGDFGRRQPTR